jgi:putative phosphoesterase
MPDIHRIGVISDTHLPRKAARIPDAALRHFEDVRLILHAGDLSIRAALDQLEAYAPVEAVQGNVEDDDIIRALPIKRQITVGGVLIGMVHILGDRTSRREAALREFPGARVVIYGHSHTPFVEDRDGVLLLNPGSATDRRTQPHCTIALLTITDGHPSAAIIALD